MADLPPTSRKLTGAQLRVASPGDLPEILAILAEAQDWQIEQGIPPAWGKLPVELAALSVERGTAVLVRLDGRAVATGCLEWADPDIWGDTVQSDAGYLHRVATRPAWHDRGLGRFLLDWADARVRDAGRTYLRLDAVSTNRRLCDWYLRRGFRPMGEVLLPGWVRPSLRFERRANGN